MKPVLSAFAGFLLLGTAAWGEAPVTDWVANEVVVTEAQAQGPAFWRIRKGPSEIWILGTVGQMPKDLAWNRSHLAEVIKGSRAVLTAPKASAGFFSASWFLLTHRGLLSMPDGKRLEETLPPALKTRFVAARTALKEDAKEFSDDPPVLAAVKLQGRYNEEHRLTSDEPWNSVARLAKDNKVPVRSLGDYDALAIVKEMLRLPPEGQEKCLAESVAYTEMSAQHNAALSEAWAAGDVKQIKAHFVPRAFSDCIKQSASFGKFVDRAVADYLKAIHEALAQPGKVVMVADIGALLRSTGVAEELTKEGIVIEGPAE